MTLTLSDHSDVVILGAGPAGSAAAAHLGAAGHDLLVLEGTASYAVSQHALGSGRTLGRVAARLLERPWATAAATTQALPHKGLMRLVLRRVTRRNDAQLETSRATSTMGRVIRATAHPGTERGVDQR